jgi:hypothetical protein
VAEQRKQKEKQMELKKTKVSSQQKTGSAIVFEANKQVVFVIVAPIKVTGK